MTLQEDQARLNAAMREFGFSLALALVPGHRALIRLGGGSTKGIDEIEKKLRRQLTELRKKS